MSDTTNMTQSVSDITTVGTGDGSEISAYGETFALLSSDGSGNPNGNSSSNQKSYYNKDLDLVQNMRNCFAVVAGFKEQVDSIVLAAGYGGWTIITEHVDPSDRIEGLMYLRVIDVTTGTNANGEAVSRYNLQPELHTGTVMSFFSDAEISVYDNNDSYYMTSVTVKDAIDELSRRSIIIMATVQPASFETVDGGLAFGNESYTCAEVPVPGILSTDYPMVTLKPSEVATTAAIQMADAGHISRIETLNGSIKVYCYDGHKPTRELPLVFRILRGGQV